MRTSQHWWRRVLGAGLTLTLALTLAACGPGGSGSPAGSPASGGPSAGRTVAPTVGGGANASFDTSQGSIDIVRLKTPLDMALLDGHFANVGDLIPMRYRMREYAGQAVVRQALGTVTFRVDTYDRTQTLSPADEGVGTANKYLTVNISIRGDAGNFGRPVSFTSMAMPDPSPDLYLVDRAGAKRENQTIKSLIPTNRLKGGTSLLSIKLANPDWALNVPVFIIPNQIEQPTLVFVTYLGADTLSYAAVRLY